MSPDFFDATEDETDLHLDRRRSDGRDHGQDHRRPDAERCDQMVVLDAVLHKAEAYPMPPFEGKPAMGFTATPTVCGLDYGLGAFAPSAATKCRSRSASRRWSPNNPTTRRSGASGDRAAFCTASYRRRTGWPQAAQHPDGAEAVRGQRKQRRRSEGRAGSERQARVTLATRGPTPWHRSGMGGHCQRRVPVKMACRQAHPDRLCSQVRQLDKVLQIPRIPSAVDGLAPFA